MPDELFDFAGARRKQAHPFLRRHHSVKGEAQIAPQRPQRGFAIGVGHRYGSGPGVPQIADSPIERQRLRSFEELVVARAFARIRNRRVRIDGSRFRFRFCERYTRAQLLRLRAERQEALHDLRLGPFPLIGLAQNRSQTPRSTEPTSDEIT